MFATDLIEFTAKVNHSICSSSAEKYWLIAKATVKSRTFNATFSQDAIKPFQMRRRNSPDSYFYVSYVLKNTLNGRVMGYDYGYILLRQVLPVATISGVFFANKGDGNITLNVSLSHYPQQASSLRFTWLCRRSSETFTVPPSIVDYPNANSNASGGCYGYGPGKLSATTKVLVVDVDKMDEGQTYVFELFFTNGVRSSKAVHRLSIFPRTKFFIR